MAEVSDTTMLNRAVNACNIIKNIVFN